MGWIQMKRETERGGGLMVEVAAACDYGAFLHDKVAVARISAGSGHGRSNDEVEADFASLRAFVRRR
jgi:hypothetical protein